MRRLTFAVVLALLVLALVPATGAAGASGRGERGMAGRRSVWGVSQKSRPGSLSAVECTATGNPSANVKLDCDDPYPNNEPDVEVDPTDPQHMIASSNDYGTCCDQFYTTFDGGASWTTGNMSNLGPPRYGSDPVTVFDVKHGTVLHPSLSYTANVYACNGDLVVSISKDGGVTWQPPLVVSHGSGCDLSATQLFNDKEWIVVDNNPASPHYGTAYLTWSLFLAHHGNYVSSAIYEAHSTDGGYTWSKPQEISGSDPALCTFQEDGVADGSCDENQFSVPTVAPNGTVYVAFENEQNQALWEPGEQFDDQYLLVKSADGGQTWSSPAFVAGLEDGTRDYPVSVRERQTLTGYQVRVNSAGNIVAAPSSGKLFLVFSDNRAGTRDSNHPVTNTNVYVMTSTTGGASWSRPRLVDSSSTDQWFPWAEVDPTTGRVGIVYNDRLSSNPSLYNASLAEQGVGGGFVKTVVSTAASHPTQSLFFRAGVTGCELCATFHGDYINLSYGSDGTANLVWTDMRDLDVASGTYRQFIYFARR
jgi:hypothetical protein